MIYITKYIWNYFPVKESLKNAFFGWQGMLAEAFNKQFLFPFNIKGSSINFFNWNSNKFFKWNTVFAFTWRFLYPSCIQTAAWITALYRSELSSHISYYFKMTSFTWNVTIRLIATFLLSQTIAISFNIRKSFQFISFRQSFHILRFLIYLFLLRWFYII